MSPEIQTRVINRLIETGNGRRPHMTFAEAPRAIFIDFECLEGRPPKPPHPALLGVLVGLEAAQFGQIINDGTARAGEGG